MKALAKMVIVLSCWGAVFQAATQDMADFLREVDGNIAHLKASIAEADKVITDFVNSNVPSRNERLVTASVSMIIDVSPGKREEKIESEDKKGPEASNSPTPTSSFSPVAASSASAFTSPIGSRPLRITSEFGNRWHPYWGKIMFHEGIDIAGRVNSTVLAAAEGVVLEAKYSVSYGYYIIILHRNDYKTVYAHLNALGVKKGERVDQGQRIGTIGSTGISTGPHLHFEVRYKNRCVDPEKFLSQNK